LIGLVDNYTTYLFLSRKLTIFALPLFEYLLSPLQAKTLRKYLILVTVAFALSSCAAYSRVKKEAEPFGEKLGEKLAETIPHKTSSPMTETWQVIKVADGDTVIVTRGNRKEKIRFCGIDAPESKQPLGYESKDNLQRLIDEANGEVQLSIIETDRYGRKVAEIFTVSGEGKEKFLQEEQLKARLAYFYAKYASNCPNSLPMQSAEAIAKANHSGVWGGNYEKPWDYRKSRR
jgi:endonuclease YncB( thermonuclease family)